MTELEELWRRKSDEQLFEAFAYLDEYSDEGQRVIRGEFLRRNLTEPSKKPITFREAAHVATLYRRFAAVVAGQWLSLIVMIFVTPLLSRSAGSILALLCLVVFLMSLIVVPMTGYRLLKCVEVESPGRLAVLMRMPLFSLLALMGMRSFTQRWSKDYGVDMGFLGPTKESLARLRDADGGAGPSSNAAL